MKMNREKEEEDFKMYNNVVVVEGLEAGVFFFSSCSFFL